MGVSDRPWRRAGTAVLEREATLAPERVSPREARQLLREVASAAGRDDWLDAGELAISEVVTNALLHAHTGVTVWVAVYEDELCVEVQDANPTIPAARGYDEQASTGRGLGLVAAVARQCGIHSLGPDGKVVWFCIGDPAANTLADWDIDEFDDDDVRTAPEPNVVLLRMPPTLWLSARQHHDALLRELALYGAEHDVVDDVDLARADAARGRISAAVVQAIEEAHAEGRTRSVLPPGHPSPLPWVPDDLELGLYVAPEEAPDFLALADLLDLAERLAVEGRLLVRPGLPEIIAVRDWACDQVVAQVGGSPPAPWPGTAQERFETESHGRDLVDEQAWDVALVRDADRGVVAADDANRIVAISASLAAALGWDREALIGRRVVTLIPPHLREAHVAGFSRHLSTGESHVLGVELELPVLHADGHEVRCRFLIEQSAVGAGRTVYLAWIDPLT